MTIRYLSPRAHNRSGRVDLFMKLWDRPLSEAQSNQLKKVAPVSQQRSSAGNLNNEGTPYPSLSCLISRFHPDFEGVIEPGVKELLLMIAVDLNLVTYTSCEGHHYSNSDCEPDERHVGMIPRNAEELSAILNVFEQVGTDVNSRYPDGPVEVAIMKHTVLDYEKAYPAVDIYLSRREGATWQGYFDHVDEVCSELVSRLRQITAIA
jgi:hypothetical protein